MAVKSQEEKKKMTIKAAAPAKRGRPKKVVNHYGPLTKVTGDLHNKLAEEEGNLFYSAYSLDVALGMCHQGATGSTKKEIGKTLDLPKDSEAYYQYLVDIATGKSDLYTLKTANALWVSNKLGIEKKFVADCANHFKATADVVDFDTDAVDKVNAWASEHTNDKIKKILSKANVNEATRLVLTNAIYFKSNWKDKFEKAFTDDRPFLNCGNVPTMSGEKRVRYHEDDTHQVIELPYEGNELSMVIMLPKENNTSAIDQNFEAYYNGLANTLNQTYTQQVIVQLPKFKLETSYNLTEVVKGMGIEQAFTDGADFSNISEEELKISFILQKAFVQVDESGTEAAAVTAVGLACCTSVRIPELPKQFIANKPFVFCIRHNKSNEILFTGRVTDPRN